MLLEPQPSVAISQPHSMAPCRELIPEQQQQQQRSRLSGLGSSVGSAAGSVKYVHSEAHEPKSLNCPAGSRS
jgi:hypothetical protein